MTLVILTVIKPFKMTGEVELLAVGGLVVFYGERVLMLQFDDKK